MIRAPLYDKSGNRSGEIELPAKPFELKPNEAVVWQYVNYYLANQRTGTHSAKTRSEVSGGGRKPWPQKGTGLARHGSIRSPLWRKGGVIFPPKPREYRQRLPKKMKRLALASVLSDRAKENRIFVFEDIKFEKPETKKLLTILENSGIEYSRPTLIITDVSSPEIYKSASSIPKLLVTHIGQLNAYEAIKSYNLIIFKKALLKLKELYGNETS